MNQLKFLSREKLVEYLDEELRTFLNDKGIYEINQYGWLMDDSPDPEYLGLAMWQAEPPGRRAIPFLGPGRNAHHLSDLGMAQILEAGREFEALMQKARQSIGFTLLYHETSVTLADNLNFCFWHHYSDTIMKLNMATETLREVFIKAFSQHVGFGFPSEIPSGGGDPMASHSSFYRPFLEAKAKLAESPQLYSEILDCFRELLPLVEQASLCRLDGMEVNCNQALFQDACVGSISLGGHNELSVESPEENSLVKDFGPQEITSWYKVLINAGNQVFLAEYLLRNFNPEFTDC